VTSPEPTIALVFSPESWVEHLHRHLADHGGARVRQIVVEPSVALDEEYDALVVSDRWPALTPGFVEAVHARGRRILGVFDPDEPAGKDHLVGLSVDATIAADAAVDEFVAAVNGLTLADRSWRPSAGPVVPAGDGGDSGTVPGGRLVVVTGPRGTGVTEIAVALAASDRGSDTVLVDGHETAPSVAVRLGLALEPNLRGAVEARAFGAGQLDGVVLRPRSTGFHVLVGFPSLTAAAQVTPRDVLDVVAALQSSYRRVVVDIDGSVDAVLGRALVASSTTIVGVGQGSPVGVARLISWLVDTRELAPSVPVAVVVNRAPRDRFRQAEITAEICRAVPPSTLVFVPTDRHVEEAGWLGGTVASGQWAAGLARLAANVAPAPTRRRQRSRRPRGVHQ
jgi:MinD-like ATPase involved in chromosome partitioning or flagellar assembly